jgi:hypothetical protein
MGLQQQLCEVFQIDLLSLIAFLTNGVRVVIRLPEGETFRSNSPFNSEINH